MNIKLIWNTITLLVPFALGVITIVVYSSQLLPSTSTSPKEVEQVLQVEPTLEEIAYELCGQYDLNYQGTPGSFYNCVNSTP